MTTYTKAQLQAMPTLSQGQASNLKVDTGRVRVWVSRMTRADGAEHDHAIEVERLNSEGKWRLSEVQPHMVTI